jgi:uncharacterized repeat protein (TIGR03803 family)
VIYSFGGGSDGAYPEAGLLRDGAGNLYGTTQYGGVNNAGTVFKFAPDGTESVLHSFGSTNDGANPVAALVSDKAGNLYGTTEDGGADNAGTVFELAPSGTETVLYSFRGKNDGSHPAAGLLLKSGRLYGTTLSGGKDGLGVVFRLAPNGRESVLHDFAGGSDGRSPLAALIMDRSGNIYGTTSLGGADNQGTVFMIAPNGTETVVHAFAGSDGARPGGALVADKSGNLFGTTLLGGADDSGTVFQIAPDETESVLYSFTGGSDGADPSCNLVLDRAGDLYGTTPVTGGDGSGAVFELAANGTLTVLHAFSGSGGANPAAGLTAAGNYLYGTTPESGTYGYGTVFRLKQ